MMNRLIMNDERINIKTLPFTKLFIFSKLRLLFSLVLLLFPFSAFAQGKQKFKLPDALNEVSGLVFHTADSLYWLNDGGNSPTLFLTDRKGNILRKRDIPQAINRDWEDLTRDNQGNFYIGDFGNNANKRRNLRVYIFNPEKNSLDSILFNFPDQTAFPPVVAERNFDTEAFFWKDNTLHLFSKSKLGNGNFTTRHYRLSDQSGTQIAQLAEEKYLKKRVITAAALSPDGKTVVLLSYHFKRILGFFPISKTSVFSFTNFTDDNFLSGNMKKHKVCAWIFPTQYESIDFCEKNKVIIASERTAFIRARGRKIKLK